MLKNVPYVVCMGIKIQKIFEGKKSGNLVPMSPWGSGIACQLEWVAFPPMMYAKLT